VDLDDASAGDAQLGILALTFPEGKCLPGGLVFVRVFNSAQLLEVPQFDTFVRKAELLKKRLVKK
jgi:hypothetical protein